MGVGVGGTAGVDWGNDTLGRIKDSTVGDLLDDTPYQTDTEGEECAMWNVEKCEG